MANLTPVDPSDRTDVTTLDTSSDRLPVTVADKIIRPGSATTDNSVEDGLVKNAGDIASVSALAKRNASALTDLALQVRGDFEPATQLDADAGWALGSSVDHDGIQYLTPLTPLTAKAGGTTNLWLRVPSGVDPDARVTIVRGGSTIATHPATGELWKAQPRPSGVSPHQDYYILDDPSDTGSEQVSVAYNAGDIFHIQIAGFVHEPSVPLSAIEGAGATAGQAPLWDATDEQWKPGDVSANIRSNYRGSWDDIVENTGVRVGDICYWNATEFYICYDEYQKTSTSPGPDGDANHWRLLAADVEEWTAREYHPGRVVTRRAGVYITTQTLTSADAAPDAAGSKWVRIDRLVDRFPGLPAPAAGNRGQIAVRSRSDETWDYGSVHPSALVASDSIGVDDNDDQVYLRATDPGTVWGSPDPAPRDGRAVPMRVRELGSDDVRDLPEGQYNYDYHWTAGNSWIMYSRNRQLMNSWGNRSGAYDGSRPGMIWNPSSSDRDRWTDNNVEFTAANAGTTVEDYLMTLTLNLIASEWRAGDTLLVELFADTDQLDQQSHTYHFADSGNPDQIQWAFHLRPKKGVSGEANHWGIALTMTPGDGRASTTRTLTDAVMNTQLPFVGRYPVQGLRSGEAYYPIDPLVDPERQWSGYAMAVRGDDNQSTVSLELLRQSGTSQGNGVGGILRATTDMRQVALRAWGSQADQPPHPSGYDMAWWTWLPGVLAPRRISSLPISDANWHNPISGLYAVAEGVLRDQRFALIAETEFASSVNSDQRALAVGVPWVTWDVNPRSSAQPSYTVLSPGLLATHRVYQPDAANSFPATVRTSPREALPDAPPTVWSGIWISATKHQGNAGVIFVPWHPDIVGRAAAGTTVETVAIGVAWRVWLDAQGVLQIDPGQLDGSGQEAVNVAGIWIEYYD